MLLPSPGAGERLRGEREGAERVREEQRGGRRRRPGTVGAGGRAERPGGARLGDRPQGGRPARLRCAGGGVLALTGPVPSRSLKGGAGAPSSLLARGLPLLSPEVRGVLKARYFPPPDLGRNAGRPPAEVGGDSSDPGGTA